MPERILNVARDIPINTGRAMPCLMPVKESDGDIGTVHAGYHEDSSVAIYVSHRLAFLSFILQSYPRHWPNKTGNVGSHASLGSLRRRDNVLGKLLY